MNQQTLRNRQQGFTLFELVIAGSLVLVLTTGTYIRYQSLQIEAEQAAFKGVISWLQAGINLTITDAYSRHQLESISQLHQTNPMALMTRVMTPPSNYLGELRSKNAAQVEPGHWYYDLDQRRLVYHVRYTQNVDGLVVENQRISFQLQGRHSLPGEIDGELAGRIRLVPDQYGLWQSALGFGRPPRQTIDNFELALHR